MSHGLRIQRAAQNPAVEVMLDALDNLLEEVVACLPGHIAHVRRPDDVLQRQERVTSRQRFDVEDVKGRAGDLPTPPDSRAPELS